MPPKTKTIALVANASRKKYKKFTLNELSAELAKLNKLEKKQTTPANVIRINVIKEMVEDSKVCKNQKKKEEPLKIKKPAPKKKEEPKKKERRIFKLRQIDKNNIKTKEDEVPLDDLEKKIIDVINKRGYFMSKNQLKELKSGMDYLKDTKEINKYNIKEGKGKTDMLILSMESFGDSLFSIRVKKK